MLDRAVILDAFSCLSRQLGDRGVIGELHLMGGAVMMLAFQARQATKDVDAIFAPAQEVRAAAARVAAEMGLPADWLNDGAKGFASERGDYSDQVLPQFPNLRILTPTPEYMLAMKVIAGRTADQGGQGDKDDIRLLLNCLDLRTSEEVMAVVLRYYPPSQVLPRSLYLVDEILQERSPRT